MGYPVKFFNRMLGVKKNARLEGWIFIWSNKPYSNELVNSYDCPHVWRDFC
jgi:hypothetical protein